MSLKLAIFALLLLFCVVVAHAAGPVRSTEETKALWNQFKEDFARKYTDQKEHDYRYSVFLANLNRLEEVREVNPKGFFGITKFFDMTIQEFSGKYGTKFSPEQALNARQATNMSTLPIPTAKVDFSKGPLGGKMPLPKDAPLRGNQPVGVEGEIGPVGGYGNFDWRWYGIITAVKDQMECGSCWDFAAVETIESAWALHSGTGQVLSLSTQQCLDCSGGGSCGGGYPAYVLQYAMYNWVVMDQVYPYLGYDYYCYGSVPSPMAAYLSGAWYVTPYNGPDYIMQAIYTISPVTFCIQGDLSAIQYYQGGIVTSCAGPYYEGHCMQITGWDSTSFNWPTYIVRNQWGAGFGYGGYIYFDATSNPCGINNEAYVAA